MTDNVLRSRGGAACSLGIDGESVLEVTGAAAGDLLSPYTALPSLQPWASPGHASPIGDPNNSMASPAPAQGAPCPCATTGLGFGVIPPFCQQTLELQQSCPG